MNQFKINALFKEFLSIGSIQFFNMLLPIIVFPFIIRQLGVKLFGTFVLAQSFGMYFDLVVTYGYSLTAANDIVTIENSKSRIAKANIIINTKLFIFLCLVFSLILCKIFFEDFGISNTLLIISLLSPIGNVFLLDWYFQAVQQTKYVLIATLFAKLFSFCMIIFILPMQRSPETALLILGLSNLIAGFISIKIIYTKFNLKLKVIKFSLIYNEIKINFWSFISIILVPMYSTVNYFILKYFHGELALGIYSIPEKVSLALGSLQTVINKPLIPYLTKVRLFSINKFETQTKNIIVYIFFLFGIIAATVFIFSDFFIKIIVGRQSEYIIQQTIILKILCGVIVLSPLASFLQSILIILNKPKVIFKVAILTVMVNLSIVFYLTKLYSSLGTGYSFLIVNIFLMFILLYYFLKETKVKKLGYFFF